MWAFKHIMVRDAAYDSLAKVLRAELHERFADRLDAEYATLPDLDEFVGYHLEQAHRLRTELGETGRHTERLAEDGGRRLGEAGVRAAIRADVPASIALLQRAVELLPLRSHGRADLLYELGIDQEAAGDHDLAIEAYELAIEEARATNDVRIELSARIELESVRLPRSEGRTADALLEATSKAIPVLEEARDHRRLGRALLFAGWVQGGRRGHHQARQDAAERALQHYRQSTWPTSTCIGEIANALYYGPTPVPEAIARSEDLLADDALTRYGRANVEVFLGGLVAQKGDRQRARQLISSAETTYQELGHRTAVTSFSGAIRGDIELLADDAKAAEQTFRWICERLETRKAFSRLASRAGDLAEALYRLGRFAEAAEWAAVGEEHSASDDLDAQVLWMPVRAKLLAVDGAIDDALTMASRGIDVAEASDGLNRRAAAWCALGEIHLIAGRPGDASTAFSSALDLLEQKGNLVGASRVRARLGELAPA